MRYLLDASALVPLIVDCGEALILRKPRLGMYTTELGVYEAGNALWKLAVLTKDIAVEDAAELLSVLQHLIKRRVVELISIHEINLEETVRIAARERMTFYDASYVVAARMRGLTLVTEDRELREKAASYISVTPYTVFRSRVC